MATVTVSRSGDRLIAVKHVPAGHVGDIEREAETLQRLDHPGVVRFVDLIETPDHGRALHTEFVSSDTWSTRPITDPTERAEGVAAVAEVVADLHDMGIAHAQIDPSHVLHGDGDRPVLCGFGLSTEASPENRRGDLVAIADLCHDPALEQGPLVEKLSTLADAARAGRLDVRELARRLNTIPDKRSTATEPGRAAADRTNGWHRVRSSKRLLVIAAALCASTAVLAAVIWSRSGRATSTPATIIDAAAPQAVAPGSPTGESAASAAPDSAATPVPYSTPMIPGALSDGSRGGPSRATGSGGAFSPDANSSLPPPAPIPADTESPAGFARHESGAILEHGGNLYGVGAPGDFVETGDWNCDGRPTPAIIRPSTGHVVLFDAWPAPHQSIAMPVRWAVEAPTGAEAVANGGCDLLRVYTPAGSRLFDPMEGQ